MAILGWPYRWSPLREAARLQDELEKMLSTWKEQGVRFLRGGDYPPVNIYSKGENLVLTVEVPGMRQEEIELTITGATVAIKGERKEEPGGEGARYHRRERRTGDFVRAVQLPEEVDAEKATAVYRAGILTVTLPRSEAARARKISVH